MCAISRSRSFEAVRILSSRPIDALRLSHDRLKIPLQATSVWPRPMRSQWPMLPMHTLQGSAGFALVAGIVGVALLLAWQIRDIAQSPYPRIRAAGAMATSVPLFLILFATTYYLMGQNSEASFTEPLNKLDALYFTVTVFATVGFGDIAPVSQVHAPSPCSR